MTPQPIFLSAEWRNLLMLNYEIDPEILRPYVPKGTELDSWNGRYYISLVAFMFENTKLLGVKIPFHVNFEEVNLRFYVRRKGPEGWRRGVVFVKELVPKWAIATVARLIYNENYVYMPMKHYITPANPQQADSPSIRYQWRSGNRWHKVVAQAIGPARPLVANSEEQFITEHYWGYAKQRNDSTVEYQVMHPPWHVWQVNDYQFECDVAHLYGKTFAEALRPSPQSIFIADGSAVTVHKGVNLS